jgi:ketosteroid isomerase-like protein
MSDHNVEIVRRAYEALRRDGVEGLLEFIHPEFEGEAPPELSVEPDIYLGREGVRHYFDSFYEAVDEVRFEPEEFIDAGDRVVIPMRLVVKGRGSGIETDLRMTQVWTMQDELVVRIFPYVDKETALEAVGLKRPTGPRSTQSG